MDKPFVQYATCRDKNDDLKKAFSNKYTSKYAEDIEEIVNSLLNSQVL